MKVALLINERLMRARVAEQLRSTAERVDEFPTATEALKAFAARAYDVIAIEWKVYPGFGSEDSLIQEMATLIPQAQHTANLLYWQTGLRVIEKLREDDAPCRAARIVVRFPMLAPDYTGADSELTRETVDSDLARYPGVTRLLGASLDEFAAAIVRPDENPASRRPPAGAGAL